MEIFKSFARFMMLIMVNLHHSQGKSYELQQEGLGETLETQNTVAKDL